MSYPRHKVGDIVRLAKGWTPMTVIGLTPDDEVIAQYGTNPFPEDLQNPERALSTYTRPHYGFTQWDGKPMKGSIMTKRYRVLDTLTVGKYMQTTSQGRMALEFDDGSVAAFHPNDLIEVIPQTFSVKVVNGNNYKTHCIQPDGVEIKKDDMLLSSCGNLYIVTAVDTRNPTAGLFKGQRVLMAPL